MLEEPSSLVNMLDWLSSSRTPGRTFGGGHASNVRRFSRIFHKHLSSMNSKGHRRWARIKRALVSRTVAVDELGAMKPVKWWGVVLHGVTFECTCAIGLALRSLISHKNR